MADYYPTLTRAVLQLNTNSAEARLELFERARMILRAHLRDGPESELFREGIALESAIRRVETEAGFGSPPISPSFAHAWTSSVTARGRVSDREDDQTSLLLRQRTDSFAFATASQTTSDVPTYRGSFPDLRPPGVPELVPLPFEDVEEAETYGQAAPQTKVGKRKKLKSEGQRATTAGLGLAILILLAIVPFIGAGLLLSIVNLPRLVWELEHAPDHPRLLAVLISAGCLVGILFFAIARRGIPRSVLAAIDAIGSVRLGIPWGKMGRSAGEFSDRL